MRDQHVPKGRVSNQADCRFLLRRLIRNETVATPLLTKTVIRSPKCGRKRLREQARTCALWKLCAHNVAAETALGDTAAESFVTKPTPRGAREWRPKRPCRRRWRRREIDRRTENVVCGGINWRPSPTTRACWQSFALSSSRHSSSRSRRQAASSEHPPPRPSGKPHSGRARPTHSSAEEEGGFAPTSSVNRRAVRTPSTSTLSGDSSEGPRERAEAASRPSRRERAHGVTEG